MFKGRFPYLKRMGADEEKKKNCIALISLTKRMILKHLDILAIEPVEHM